MKLDHTTQVTADHGPRPFGRPDECFYCHQAIGKYHTQACPMRQKVVMVEVTMTIPVAYPEGWDAEQINFHLNDSSWCADNVEIYLTKYLKSKGEEAPCMCSAFEGRYIKDATEEDLTDLDLKVLSE